MKKHGILNQPVAAVIASMGHKDQLTICDAGLPIPPANERIDLAVHPGIPGFLQVVSAVIEDLEVEEIILAEEIIEQNPCIYEALLDMFDGVKISFLPHDDFKSRSRQSRAFVRTGECTPYANIILISGVIF